MARYIDADKLKAYYAWQGHNAVERRTFDEIVDAQPVIIETPAEQDVEIRIINGIVYKIARLGLEIIMRAYIDGKNKYGATWSVYCSKSFEESFGRFVEEIQKLEEKETR